LTDGVIQKKKLGVAGAVSTTDDARAPSSAPSPLTSVAAASRTLAGRASGDDTPRNVRGL
jgi:hypothetical protein